MAISHISRGTFNGTSGLGYNRPEYHNISSGKSQGCIQISGSINQIKNAIY
ncbi:hypothetical protein [Cylindrospermopsis raciborskii]|uniref:hypothetical protein n=1 Tax=Cylindrospermopsis raciborskii TaxID=77022 RepID=UPI00030CAD17|nr:hypothetical protein [Cylindrospermopsis raciborskii]MBA4449485.1 hypothetical protein [Cylindrospermopsis raciborskii CS-506_D]MBU6344097.1 hypothetical protein [Cyanobacteria bacterium REEB494]UJL34792.1 hypothetical protein C6N34_006345 [Cylindrospermopsis raciborskii Cr2010]UJS04308.1 hypothetical protein L3I90_14665 [Cylindrospermopsis raciborskii KLL07]